MNEWLWNSHDEYVVYREIFKEKFPFPPHAKAYSHEVYEILRWIKSSGPDVVNDKLFACIDQNSKFYTILDPFKAEASTKPYDPVKFISPYVTRDAQRKWYIRAKKLFDAAFQDYLTICRLAV